MRIALALITVLCVAACGGASGQSGATGTNAKAASAQALKFSSCMRANGVPNFPDPGSGGGIDIAPGSGLDPQSPAFQAAQKACGKLLPGGGPGARKPTRAQFVAALAFAKCMRTHGLPRFPDPLASDSERIGPDHLPARHDVPARPGARSTVARIHAGRLALRDQAPAATDVSQPAVARRQWPISPSYSSDRVISRYSVSVTASRLCPGGQ